MPEESEIQKLKEKYPELFEQLPAKLIGLVGSEKTASQIAEICLGGGTEDEEKIEKIASQIGLVLLGKLPPERLAESLEKKLRLNPEVAGKISDDANRLIFSPVKDDLAKLYGKTVPAKPSAEPKETTPPPKDYYPPTASSHLQRAPKPKRPRGKDVYHEPIE